MTLSPAASWLFLGALAAAVIVILILMVQMERRSSRRFWSEKAQHDDPDYIARRNAALKAAAQHRIPRGQ